MSDQQGSADSAELEPVDYGLGEELSPPRSLGWRWVAVGVLALLVLGALGYGGYKLNRDDAKIKSLDTQVSSLNNQIETTNSTLTSASGLTSKIDQINQVLAPMTLTVNNLSAQQQRVVATIDRMTSDLSCVVVDMREVVDGVTPGLAC